MTGPVTGVGGFGLSATLPFLVSDVSTNRKPMRLGNLPAGTLIINDSADSRVWVAPTTAVTTGAGTPVDPKTTLRLTRDGDWYAIIDSNDSVAAQLYASPYVDQWQPSPGDIAASIFTNGVPFVDKPSLIGFGFPQALASGASLSFGPIDTSTFQSYFSWYGWSAPAGGYLRVTLTWTDTTGATVDQDSFVINGQGAGTPVTNGGGAFARGPCRGSGLFITFKNEGGATANFNYDMSGSLRVVTSVRVIEDTATDNVIKQGEVDPGASASQTVYLPLFSGNVNVSLQAIGTAGQTIRVIMRIGITNSTMFDKTYTIGTTPADYGMPFIFPRVPVNFLISNNGASAINGIRLSVLANEP